ncbi:Cell division inhibitor SulA [wastewater metagenome]|uniref:Cell division inhibitor SulA n=2 Tax=unclassified sequences TaxID=12908 RepID=A0A5B8R6L0_9ZZZZ|nr:MULTISPECIES: translesion DNA synthesis-associated protein ImuA [Arhodomonas]MCS4504652.1 translesion DNA synthesis-associated protein ImuA [Arhodomonas aquaeolei]QEA04081.1 cell division inhibitor SulA [uncultured organism]
MSEAVEELLRQPGIWRAGATGDGPDGRHVTTGHPALDAVLPGGGWPRGALTEVLHEHHGIGELRLLMPALAEIARQGRWVAFIAPPFVPYAPALTAQGLDLGRLLLIHPRSGTDALWAVEQALRAGTCGAVLAWPRQVDTASLRRLQLAAEAGDSLGLIFRRESNRSSASPAALRLHLDRDDRGLRMELLKCRGGGRRRVLYPETEAAPAVPAAVSAPPAAREAAGPAPVRNAATPRPAPHRRGGGRPRAAQIELGLVPRG